MRSKSEAMIAMNLYVQKIPYRYECELKLGSITLFPRFYRFVTRNRRNILLGITLE